MNFERVTEDVNQSDDLNRFFSLLKKYNHNTPLKRELMSEIETYFEYYWINDRRTIAETDADEAILDQLPDAVKN